MKNLHSQFGIRMMSNKPMQTEGAAGRRRVHFVGQTVWEMN